MLKAKDKKEKTKILEIWDNFFQIFRAKIIAQAEKESMSADVQCCRETGDLIISHKF